MVGHSRRSRESKERRIFYANMDRVTVDALRKHISDLESVDANHKDLVFARQRLKNLTDPDDNENVALLFLFLMVLIVIALFIGKTA